MTVRVNTKVRKEAERWFSRRREPAVRETEREAFARWLTAHPQHAEAYAQTEQLWERLAIVKSSSRLCQMASLASCLPGPDTSNARIQSVFSLKPLLLAAGVAAIALGLSFVLSLQHDTAPQSFLTALGEQRTVRLADGTTLRLDTQTAVDVRLSKRRREITLRSGEAAFDVAKDVNRPFVVSAGDGTVTAFGTQFQVRREGGQVAVTLVEGRVQVARTARHETQWLDPGQQATFSDSMSGIARFNVDVRPLTSWMNGRLEFRGTPLAEAVFEANRYSNRKIRIADPRLNQIAVSGTFRTGDIESVANAFEAAFPVRAQTTAQEIVLYPR